MSKSQAIAQLNSMIWTKTQEANDAVARKAMGEASAIRLQIEALDSACAALRR